MRVFLTNPRISAELLQVLQLRRREFASSDWLRCFGPDERYSRSSIARSALF